MTISDPGGAATGLITAIILALGPEVGTYALILFGALIGVMHSISKVDFSTKPGFGSPTVKAVFYLLTWVGTAIVLTSFAAALISKYLGFPAENWPGVVSFGITFLADKWPNWVVWAFENSLGKIFNIKPGEPK